MYAVEAFSTTARSIMDREPFPHHTTEPIASEFYVYTVRHQYLTNRILLTGVARDISVSQAGYERFWNLPEGAAEHLPVGTKVQETYHDEIMTLGFIGSKRGQKTFTITIVDGRHGALMGHATRNR